MAEPRRKAGWVLLLSLCLCGVCGAGAHLLGRDRESTDDAQIEGRVITVASRVPGQVRRVLVRDNQLVEEGQLLIELDESDLKVRLLSAQADLAAARAARDLAETQVPLTQKSVRATLRQARGLLRQARSGEVSSASQVAQAQADLRAAEARRRLAAQELERATSLRDRGAFTRADFDNRRSQDEQALAAVQLAEARLLNATAGTGGSAGVLDAAQGRVLAARTGPQQLAAARAQAQAATARVQQAEAAVRLCELNLSYARVLAPVRGVVSRRTVEVGAQVSPERALLALVPPDDVWIVANFKEDQLGRMRPGQRAQLKVDTYGEAPFVGHIESIAPATGARFSILPPDNATGNFVKVAQRVPVLIRLDGDSSDLPLRPGMSAAVTVYTR